MKIDFDWQTLVRGYSWYKTGRKLITLLKQGPDAITNMIIVYCEKYAWWNDLPLEVKQKGREVLIPRFVEWLYKKLT